MRLPSLLCRPATTDQPSTARLRDTESALPETTVVGAPGAEVEDPPEVRNVFAHDYSKSRVGGTAFHDFPRRKYALTVCIKGE